jgi:hypothetical protein
MVHQSFILSGENCTAEAVTEFVRFYYQQAYETHYPGGFMRVYEDYSFMNGNQLMVCLRVDLSKSGEQEVIIEMICGGGSTGPFDDFTMGSEDRRIKRFREKLAEFCEERGLEWGKNNDEV